MGTKKVTIDSRKENHEMKREKFCNRICTYSYVHFPFFPIPVSIKADEATSMPSRLHLTYKYEYCGWIQFYIILFIL